MRDGWTETTLGDIAEYINGYPFKPSDLGDEGTAVIRIKQLLDPMEKVDRTTVDVPERCVLSNGDIVFSWSGTLAVRVWNRGTAFLNQHLFRVVEKSGISHEWLPLVIDHAIDDLVEKSHGTTMKHITKQTLLPHQVLLPPLMEQKRIVDVVSSVDVYIDALQQQSDTARTARDAVLHELLSAGGDGWTETTLGAVAEWFSGGTPKAGKSEFYENGTIPWVVIADMMKTEIFDTASKITKAGLAEIGGRVAPKDSVLISMYATVGRPGFAHIPVATNQAIAWSVPNEKMIQPRFLLLVAQFLESEISSMARGATQRNINRAMLKEFSFNLPPLVEQKRIVEIVSSMDEVIQSTEQAVTDAKNLRSGLLSDLLSGEHEIPASYDSLLGAA